MSLSSSHSLTRHLLLKCPKSLSFIQFAPYSRILSSNAFLTAKIPSWRCYSTHYRQLDVTKHNFAEAHEQFLSHLKRASFVSFDFEFTGLELSSASRNVFNESLDARYEKLRKAVQRFVPLQMGICVWEKESAASQKTTNDEGSQEARPQRIDAASSQASSYIARSFNFNIFPQYTKVFLVETSALQFLIENQFDFNKVIRDGIPFMNEVESAKQRQEIESYGTASLQKYSLEKTHPAYQVIQDYLEDVQRFRNTATLGQTRVVTVERSFHLNVLEQEILRRFPDVFPIKERHQSRITLHFVNETLRSQLIAQEKEKKLQRLEERNGMTRIINSIIASRVPVVCHNGMYDLLYLYHHFIRPLPLVAGDFKRQLSESFPMIFDTKYIVCNAGEVKTLLGQDTRPEALNLGALYQYCSTNLATSSDVAVRIPSQFGNCEGREVAHEAGYDSFMTGVVMLRFMNHVCKQTPAELEKALKEHRLGNRIAVSSAEYCMAL